MLILARARRIPAPQRKTLSVHYIDPTIVSCHDVRQCARVAQKGSTIASCRHSDIAIARTCEDVRYDVGGQSSRDRECLTFRSQCRKMCGLCEREHGSRFSESATRSVAFLNDGNDGVVE